LGCAAMFDRNNYRETGDNRQDSTKKAKENTEEIPSFLPYSFLVCTVLIYLCFLHCLISGLVSMFISVFISMFLLYEDRHENIKVKKFETKEVNKEPKKRKNWKPK
jgi:hypothetical protein